MALVDRQGLERRPVASKMALEQGGHYRDHHDFGNAFGGSFRLHGGSTSTSRSCNGGSDPRAITYCPNSMPVPARLHRRERLEQGLTDAHREAALRPPKKISGTSRRAHSKML